ncbi:MAG: phosphate acyltransferase PlsX [Oscillospiraceae bacterium]|nr:phosphate acyltransferase PlsX [Oscillospiraceae bacterium]
MKIIVDAFGGDNAPLEIIKGCAEAVREYDVDILLTGDEETIRRVAKNHNISLYRMEIVQTNSVITMEDHPGAVLKEKADSSMAEGLRLVSQGKGDAFVSAGNSGALTVGTSMIVRRIKGIKRVAFGAILPTATGNMLLLDSGANAECRADMLHQFAVMGSIYMEKVMGVSTPRIGLANVGEEEHKGSQLYQDTYQLLKADTTLRFVGNVEGRDMPGGVADVIVADGFTGNMILKTYEGVAMYVMKLMKNVFYKNTKNKLAAAVMKKDLGDLKKMMDYNETGGAPIMGALKPVFKAHGSSKANTIKNAIRLTKEYVANNVVEVISKAVPGSRTEQAKAN